MLDQDLNSELNSNEMNSAGTGRKSMTASIMSRKSKKSGSNSKKPKKSNKSKQNLADLELLSEKFQPYALPKEDKKDE